MAHGKTWAFGVGPRASGFGLWLRVGVETVEIVLPRGGPRAWTPLLGRLVGMMAERFSRPAEGLERLGSTGLARGVAGAAGHRRPGLK